MPLHSLTVPLPQDCRAFWLVPMSIVIGAAPQRTMWLLPHRFQIRCVTIFGIPGWAPTEDTAQTAGKGPPRLQPESSSVDCENLGERQYTLVPEGFFPRSLHACTGWRGVCDNISRRKGWIGIITLSHCALFLDRVGYLYISCRIRHLF